jgi:rifampin ADP-ribosylating transferase
MNFDPNNNIVRLCAEGMDMEGHGKPDAASRLFSEAWDEAQSDLEKLTAAHYVARHQATVLDKLRWDDIALHCALRIDTTDIKGALPSLYLNVAKGYEDLGDHSNAIRNYKLALTFLSWLPEDGYGNMIKGGIMNGIARVSA